MTPSLGFYPFLDGTVLLLLDGLATAPSVIHEQKRVVVQGGPQRGGTWVAVMKTDPSAKQLPFEVEIDGVVHQMTAAWRQPVVAPPSPKRQARRRKAG